MKNGSRHDAIFVVIGDTGGYRNNQCHQWQQLAVSSVTRNELNLMSCINYFSHRQTMN